MDILYELCFDRRYWVDPDIRENDDGFTLQRTVIEALADNGVDISANLFLYV